MPLEALCLLGGKMLCLVSYPELFLCFHLDKHTYHHNYKISGILKTVKPYFFLIQTALSPALFGNSCVLF